MSKITSQFNEDIQPIGWRILNYRWEFTRRNEEYKRLAKDYFKAAKVNSQQADSISQIIHDKFCLFRPLHPEFSLIFNSDEENIKLCPDIKVVDSKGWHPYWVNLIADAYWAGGEVFQSEDLCLNLLHIGAVGENFSERMQDHFRDGDKYLFLTIDLDADYDKRLRPQISKLVLDKQKERKKKIFGRITRKRFDLYRRYLDIYDFMKEGQSPADIAYEVFKKKVMGRKDKVKEYIQQVMANYDQAKKIVESGFREIV